jgi:hypothetical protein
MKGYTLVAWGGGDRKLRIGGEEESPFSGESVNGSTHEVQTLRVFRLRTDSWLVGLSTTTEIKDHHHINEQM